MVTLFLPVCPLFSLDQCLNISASLELRCVNDIMVTHHILLNLQSIIYVKIAVACRDYFKITAIPNMLHLVQSFS